MHSDIINTLQKNYPYLTIHGDHDYIVSMLSPSKDIEIYLSEERNKLNLLKFIKITAINHYADDLDLQYNQYIFPHEFEDSCDFNRLFIKSLHNAHNDFGQKIKAYIANKSQLTLFNDRKET